MPRAHRLHLRGFFRRAVGDMFRNLRRLGSHLGGTCAERHSTIRGSHPAANRSSWKLNEFSLKRIWGPSVSRVPEGDGRHLLAFYARHHLDSSKRPGKTRQATTLSTTVRVALRVGLDSRSFRGRPRKSAPVACSDRLPTTVSASALHPRSPPTAGPPSLTPPFPFPTKSTEQPIADNLSPQLTFPSGRVETGMEHGEGGRRTGVAGPDCRRRQCGCQKSGVTWCQAAQQHRIHVWAERLAQRETDPSGTRDILFHDAVWFHVPDRTRTRTLFPFAQAGRHRDGGLGISRQPADLRSRRNRHLEPGQGNHFFYSQCRRLSLYSPQPNAPTMCYGPFPTPQTPNMLTASTLPFVMGSGGEL
jgi:hypothetical protein